MSGLIQLRSPGAVSEDHSFFSSRTQLPPLGGNQGHRERALDSLDQQLKPGLLMSDVRIFV